MTQVSAQSDQHNVHMAQQQMQLQAATLWSNAQQLANLGSYMSNIRKEVGKMIANNPTQSMIHVTISQPNAGKFIDRLGLWQVRTAPISYPLLPASPIQSRTEDRQKSLVTNHSCTQKRTQDLSWMLNSQKTFFLLSLFVCLANQNQFVSFV